MKQETIIKGAEILKKIDHAQYAKAVLIETNEIEFSSSKRSRLLTARPNMSTGGDRLIVSGCSLPDELLEQLHSETLRYISRMRHHLDNYEYDLKQELQDLEEGKEGV